MPTFARVVYEELRPGVDMVVYGRGGELEYDLVVAPGTDADDLILYFDGASAVELDEASGELLVAAGGAELRQRPPYVYQPGPDGPVPVASAYRPLGGDRVVLALGPHRPDRSVVVDPVIEYGTYLGGSLDDVGFDVDVDAAGRAHLFGSTVSFDFPSTTRPVLAGFEDLFVARFSGDGRTVEWTTFLGSSGADRPGAVAVAADGSVALAAAVETNDFPMVNPHQPLYNGASDAVVAKLDRAGDVLFSTYYGGTDRESGATVTVGPSGNVLVAGTTESDDLETTADAYQQACACTTASAFLARFSPTGTLQYATYLGGSADDAATRLAVDARGDVYVLGHTDSADFPRVNPLQLAYGGQGDAFVTKFSIPAVVYSTFLGGSRAEQGYGIAVADEHSVWVTGMTYSDGDWPLAFALQPLRGVQDAFVARLSADGQTLLFSTFSAASSRRRRARPGSEVDARPPWAFTPGSRAGGLAAAGERLYAAWDTQDTGSSLPVTSDALQRSPGGQSDAFLFALGPSVEVVHRTSTPSVGVGDGIVLQLNIHNPTSDPLSSLVLSTDFVASCLDATGFDVAQDIVVTPGPALAVLSPS